MSNKLKKRDVMLTVENVTHAHSTKLAVSLSNGATGLFDVSAYTKKGFYKELLNENFLKLVKVDSTGMGICWPNEQDFSADTIEAELLVVEKDEKLTL